MITKKEILDSELIKLLIEIRLDSAYRLLSLKGTIDFPKINSERATGDLDDKGGLFLPGGFVYEDSAGQVLTPPNGEGLSVQDFRDQIVEIMKRDLATLIYPRGIIKWVNLDNGFFLKVAPSIVEYGKSWRKKTSFLGRSPPKTITPVEITHSYTPSYITYPYGTKSALSSCIGTCLAMPTAYYSIGKDRLGLKNGVEKVFWEWIKNSQVPVLSKDEKVLAQPYAVICHNTRYREENICGITRILGIGEFGEFATLTFEEATSSLMNDVEGRTQYHQDEILASYNGNDVVGVLRFYPRTNPGKRAKKGLTTTILSNDKDLGLDLGEIRKRAFDRYQIVS